MAEDGMAPGYMLESIANECVISSVPQYAAIYAERVALLIPLVQTEVGYQRPAPDRYRELAQYHSYGQYTKVPPELRLVGVEDNVWAHMDAAAKVRFPRADTVASAISPMHMEAAEKVAARWQTIEADRDAWITRIEEICEPLREFDAYILTFAPPGLKPIQRHMRVATSCALLEAIRHQDRLFARGVLFGMPVVEDGPGFPPPHDTGLYRPVPQHAHYTLSELHAGTARPIFSRYESGKRVYRRGDPFESSPEWYDRCRGVTTTQSDDALSACGATRDEAKAAMHATLNGDKEAIPRLCARAPTERARERLSSLLNCEVKSRKEVDSRHMELPLRDADFVQRCNTDHGGLTNVRVSRRHCVKQGVKEEDGVLVDSLRVIDDTRRSGVTRAVALAEKIDLPSFMWMALMAIALARAFYRQHGFLPRITCGLDDMKAAFRTVAKALFPVVGYVVYWSFLWTCMVAQRAYGHLYGDKAGVNNFERVSRAAAILSTRYGLVLNREYVDDFMVVDLLTGRYSAQRFQRRMMRLMGWDTEDRKHKPMNFANVGLGAHTDLSEIPTKGVATVQPDLLKIKEGVAMMEEQQKAGKCRQSEATAVVGKWRWMSQQTRNRIGTAALQPWEQRARGNDDTNEWTLEMTHALGFLRVVFSERYLPKLQLHVFAERALDEPCIVLYSDAEYRFDVASGEHRLELCWMAFDQANPKVHHASRIRVPQEYIALLVKRQTYIGQGEEMAEIGGFYSLPALFRGRRVISFVDNAGSLSHLVNGYANAPDSAQLVNMFHAALLALDIEWWGEWVPSKANVADMLTRYDRFADYFRGILGDRLAQDGYTSEPYTEEMIETLLAQRTPIRGANGAVLHMHDFVLPPLDRSWQDLEYWINYLRQD